MHLLTGSQARFVNKEKPGTSIFCRQFSSRDERLQGLGFDPGFFQSFCGAGRGPETDGPISVLFSHFLDGTERRGFSCPCPALNAENLVSSGQRIEDQALLILVEILAVSVFDLWRRDVSYGAR